ncbi:GNAT family N-acetyltransferase [Ensifer soli]|uniref:GNAT family N-acetyltransferase n=1 Tax=Ciceribacter sp. sgz301302 TaxID=3342379 RepID=UPI0035B9FBA7
MPNASLIIRQATPDDLPALIALFADDTIGGHGDTTDPAAFPAYRAAFDRIAASSSETLYVAELDGAVVGTFQTLVTVSLTDRGAAHMILEAVQVRADRRGRGIGEAMVRVAINAARAQGMASIRLTSNVKRADAHRFYQRLGFAPSHRGFKLALK